MINNTNIRAFLIGVASACCLTAMALPLLKGQVLDLNDLGTIHLPLRAFYSQCLISGDSFVWHPGIFCGYYIHGEGQVGMYHPLHFAAYGLLPLITAFNL